MAMDGTGPVEWVSHIEPLLGPILGKEPFQVLHEHKGVIIGLKQNVYHYNIINKAFIINKTLTMKSYE